MVIIGLAVFIYVVSDGFDLGVWICLKRFPRRLSSRSVWSPN